MNAVEIEQAMLELALHSLDGAEFPYTFLAAFGNKEFRNDTERLVKLFAPYTRMTAEAKRLLPQPSPRKRGEEAIRKGRQV